jgi:hypothetical protein
VAIPLLLVFGSINLGLSVTLGHKVRTCAARLCRVNHGASGAWRVMS